MGNDVWGYHPYFRLSDQVLEAYGRRAFEEINWLDSLLPPPGPPPEKWSKEWWRRWRFRMKSRIRRRWETLTPYVIAKRSSLDHDRCC